MSLSFRASPFAYWAGLCLLAAGLAGCDRDDVKVYHVVKDDSATATALPATPAPGTESGMPSPVSAENSPAQLQFSLPPDWQQVAPSQMRVASFTITNAAGPTADVGIIPLPAGDGESELALVNMWRDQMQLPALTNPPPLETITVGNDPATLYEATSEQPLIDGKFRQRVLVAELTRGPTSWFFKMTGEDSFVAAQKDTFLQFLKTVAFVSNATPTDTGLPNAPAAENPAASSIWTVPAGWQALPPSEFLVAKFSIQTGTAEAEVNVAELTGEGGGLLLNVNRWRGQLGLAPVTDTDLAGLTTPVTAAGGTFPTVDFTGTDAKTGRPTRLIGATVSQNGQTWFYKLMGNETVVSAQKNAFLQFIKSAKYP